MSSFDKLKGEFTPAHFPAPGAAEKRLEESRKPQFVSTANIVIDHSKAWEQDLETLQKFWKWVHTRQPGLIEQFQHQQSQR